MTIAPTNATAATERTEADDQLLTPFVGPRLGARAAGASHGAAACIPQTQEPLDIGLGACAPARWKRDRSDEAVRSQLSLF
jgi:hypothetical protein